jgi:hypothetical protein
VSSSTSITPLYSIIPKEDKLVLNHGKDGYDVKAVDTKDRININVEDIK